jgi:hypothetical protein
MSAKSMNTITASAVPKRASFVQWLAGLWLLDSLVFLTTKLDIQKRNKSETIEREHLSSRSYY